MGIGYRELLVLLFLFAVPIILIGGVWLVRRLTASSNPQGGHRRVAERLSELGSLRQSGQISAAEYEKQRASIISRV